MKEVITRCLSQGYAWYTAGHESISLFKGCKTGIELKIEEGR